MKESEDKRFANIKNDPRFRAMPKSERKVKIDKRFKSMFKDEKFKVKYTTDKRGRPVNTTSNEDLKRYYELSSESESEEETGKFVKAPQAENKDLHKKLASDQDLSSDVKEKLKNLKVDYARGEAALFSESSSDDEESEEESELETEEIEHKWGELDADAERTEEATSRLAACNMDWDRIRSVDLIVLFNSFLPPGGCIKSVAIYPSEFGKERMAEEEVKGPIELVESKPEEENDEENEEGSKYHMEKLRQYQLNRLKYYYAVITFDSSNSANKIYTECDGMEYESSATKIDLRFIPEDMEFDDEPKEFCDRLPELNKYQPRFFTTTALQQAKVALTWDETNPERIELTQKLNSGKIDDISEADLNAYLAGSSDEEEEPESPNDSDDEPTSNIDKYKALLQDIEEKENAKKNKDVEMEITWGIDLKDKTEKLVKQKLEESKEKTPFQQYLDKRKEKKKQKRAEKLKHKTENDNENDSDIPSDIDMNDPYFAEEFNNKDFKKKSKKKQNEEEKAEKDDALELLLLNEDDDKKHFSLKKIQEQEEGNKKKKKKQQDDNKDDFKINVEDERFSALFTSHHFNIDPTDPHFKKTKAMDDLISAKLKRRNEDKTEPEPPSKKKSNTELNMLVKSVKRKAEAFKRKG